MMGMDGHNRILIGITAYNEADNLPSILAKLKDTYDVIVIDDGSHDATKEISQFYGATVLKHLLNIGQGCADITKYKYAIEMNYDYLVEIDGDGQHDPAEIHKFIERLDIGDADIVQGSRISGSNYNSAPFFRKTFLPFYTALLNYLTGYSLTDCMCGFRAYKVDALKSIEDVFDQMLEPQYLAAEALIRFSKKGLKVVEIPIHLRPRASGESYKGFIRYGMGVLKAILRTLAKKNI